MRINTGSGLDPSLPDKLIELERLPIKAIETRKQKVVEEQKVFRELVGSVGALSSSLNALRNPTDFRKLKLESSHPDIIEGTVDNNAVPGAYEVELKHLAKTQKLLADAFPDKNETSVGFGYMVIEKEDGNSIDVEIDPDHATLDDVVRQINGLGAGVKAMVINTKEHLEGRGDDSYRLLVISEKSGKEAKVYIDPDTTYLEFKEQVTGRNLEMLFEDVPVYDDDNTVEDLLPGMILNAKRAEPGTKVNIKIDYDVDKTAESIKAFITAYNKVNQFIEDQYKVKDDPASGAQRMGPLATDSSLRSIKRAMVSAIQSNQGTAGKFRNLSDVGITSDAKTGELKADDTKLKQALQQNYDDVQRLFSLHEGGEGIAGALSGAVKGLQDSTSGAIASKDRLLGRMVKSFDDDIARKELLVKQRAEGIRRRFAAMESMISGMNAQGQQLQARLGGGAAAG